MYSLVLMSAMAGSPDALAFGKRNGCDGGCSGGRAGLFSRHKHKGGSDCGCCGSAPVPPPPPCGCCGAAPVPYLNPQPLPPQTMPVVPGTVTPTPTPGSTTPTPNPGTAPKATTPNPGSTPPKKVTPPAKSESSLPPPAAPAPRPARVD